MSLDSHRVNRSNYIVNILMSPRNQRETSEGWTLLKFTVVQTQNIIIQYYFSAFLISINKDFPASLIEQINIEERRSCI